MSVVVQNGRMHYDERGELNPEDRNEILDWLAVTVMSVRARFDPNC